MTQVTPLVFDIASHWGQDPTLIQSIVDAEGGFDALLRAVRITVPECRDYSEAVEIVCRSATHRQWEFIKKQGMGYRFVEYMGSIWAPVGAANDPTNLNANWPGNVSKGWLA